MNRRFSIDGETPGRLEARFEGTKIYVWFDGVHQTTLETSEDRKRGWTHTLDDGSTLEFRFIWRTGVREMAVLRNGEHVASSPSHPHNVLRSSSNTLLFLCGIMIVTAILSSNDDWFQWVFFAFYAAGAMLLRMRKRLGAAVIGIPLFLDLDLVVLAAFTMDVSASWIITRVLCDLLFVHFVVRAYLAANDARKLQPVTTSRTQPTTTE